MPLTLQGVAKPWGIAIGHSKLLIRVAVGDPEKDERLRVVDVVFQDVSRMSLSDKYRALHVRPASQDVRLAEMARLGVAWNDPMWLVAEGNSFDYVVAGRIYWAEVAVSPGSPSPLLNEAPLADRVVGDCYFA